jgi:hypothetical protein
VGDADVKALRRLVRADWELQEKRLGRSIHSPGAIRDAVRRAALLLDNLRRRGDVGGLSAAAADLKQFAARCEKGPPLNEDERA